jgi:hypothetical protein
MAHIFKKAQGNNKGLIVLTHQEIGYIVSDQRTHSMVSELKNNYFIGVHYGGFSYGANPYFCDFYMGRRSVTDIWKNYPNTFEIPLASGNFTSSVFTPQTEYKKYWDIINVSRNGNVKELRSFFETIRKLYDLGKNYNVLLVCASREEETEQDHFIDIANVYYEMFNSKERDMFTLMRLGKDLEFKGLSKKQLSFFYQSSKVSTLFSRCEGFPGVIPESLLCGVPVVIWKNQQGSGKDFLNEKNSVMFDHYDEAHLALIEAVESYDSFDMDMDSIKNNLSSNNSLVNLKTYFTTLYNNAGMIFDGELINCDDLVSRLPAHYTDLPWVDSRHGNGHVKTYENFNNFYQEMCGM